MFTRININSFNDKEPRQVEGEAINSQASPRVEHDPILCSARSTLMYDVRVLLPMTARVQHDPILCSACSTLMYDVRVLLPMTVSFILLPWGWVPTPNTEEIDLKLFVLFEGVLFVESRIQLRPKRCAPLHYVWPKHSLSGNPAR